MWGASGLKLWSAAALAVLVLGLTACGDDDGDDTTAQAPASTSAQPAAVNVDEFLMRRGEEPGFRPGAVAGQMPQARDTITGVKAFVKEMELTPADAQRLRDAGFISFTAGPIRGPKDAAGVTNVALYETAAGARKDLAHETSDELIGGGGASGGVKRFTVPGVPGARGWTVSDPHVGNVYWVQGRCMLVLGNQGPGDLTKPLSTGVQAIYKRTNGECP